MGRVIDPFDHEWEKVVTPHTLRHAFITAALDAGVPLRDVQEEASHADPRTTMRYDRARASLDRHATYIVSAYLSVARERAGRSNPGGAQSRLLLGSCRRSGGRGGVLSICRS